MGTMTTGEKVNRFLNLVYGEDNWWGSEVITDVLHGYAEPGYGNWLSDETPVVVLGNWNNKRSAYSAQEEGRPLTPAETFPSRLAESLERLGADLQWLDEWTECTECFRAIRTEADSYSWKPSYLWTDNGPSCHECVLEWGEDALTDYINDPKRCITWCEPSHVESFGFEKWEPGDPHTYENGWHPGQNDEPAEILDQITDVHPNAEVVFFLDESSQFYCRFSAYVRTPNNEEGNE